MAGFRPRHHPALAVAIAAVVIAVACSATGSASPTPNPRVTDASPNATGARPTATGAPPTPSSTATALAGPPLVWSQPVALPSGDAISDIVRWRESYVAVGQSTDAGGYVPAAFVSADGLHWTRTSVFHANPRLVATDTRLLAVVSQIPTPLATEVWASRDGSAWQRDDRLGLEGVSLGAVAARNDVLMATGTDQGGVLRLWRSTDDGAWSPAAMPSASAIVRNVVPVSDGFLLVGRDGVADGRPAGVGSAGTGLPAAWWSADGRAWTAARVDGTRAPGAQLTSVFRVAGAFLAIGSDATGTDGPRSPLLWSSVDGRDWQRIGPPAHWGLATSDGKQMVVFGYADAQVGTLGVWVTPDGRQWTQLAFAGAIAEVPAFIQSVTANSRVDGIFAWPDGILVIGQRNGQIAAWLASRS